MSQPTATTLALRDALDAIRAGDPDAYLQARTDYYRFTDMLAPAVRAGGSAEVAGTVSALWDAILAAELLRQRAAAQPVVPLVHLG